MKTLNGPKITFLALLGFLVIPFFAMASAPQVTSSGVQSVTRDSAVIVAQYDSGGVSYEFGNSPEMYVSYTNMQTNMTMITPSLIPFSQSGSVDIGVTNLDAGTQYSYMVDVSYNGMVYQSLPGSFITTAAAAPTTSSVNVEYAFGPDANQSLISTPAVQTIATTLGAPKVKDAVENDLTTSETVHKDGLILAVSDNQSHVIQNDSFTYSVQYSNTHNYPLTNAQIVVKLPPQYEFTSGDNATYDDQANTVTIYLDTVAANSTNTATFKAQAVGQGNATLTTTATLSYDGGSISATDINHYDGGSQSLLGASVFGAGFFPQTLWGWLGIIILIIVIVVVARRYMTTPKPKPAEAPKTA